MLEVDYQRRHLQLVSQTEWNIQLPEEMHDFFERRGYHSPQQEDERRFPRARMPLRAVMMHSKALPFRSRVPERCIGVYTANLSRCGMGFLSPEVLFPEEEVFILLPNCWFKLKVAHCRRHGERCFQIGTHLLAKNNPSAEAFDAAKELVATPAN